MTRTLVALAVLAASGGVLLTPQARALLPSARSRAAADASPPVSRAQISDLSGDLAGMRHRLASAEEQADSLRRLVDLHLAEADSARASAAELARTLTRMDAAALSAVARQLDGRSFSQLYAAASPRNQTRLLSALAPEQAAAFVRFQLPSGQIPRPSPTDKAPAADSLTARS